MAVKPVDVTLLLSAVLCGWQRNNNLPLESADEQLCNGKGLSEKQKEWLRAFCDLWDKQVESFNV